MNVTKAPPLDFENTMFVTPGTLGATPGEGVEEIFLRLHRDTVRFVRDLDYWFVWRGDHWDMDPGTRIEAAITSIAAACAHLAVTDWLSQRRRTVKFGYYRYLMSREDIEDAEALLRHLPELRVLTRGFDGCPLHPDSKKAKSLAEWIEQQPYEAMADTGTVLMYGLSDAYED